MEELTRPLTPGEKLDATLAALRITMGEDAPEIEVVQVSIPGVRMTQEDEALIAEAAHLTYLKGVRDAEEAIRFEMEKVEKEQKELLKLVLGDDQNIKQNSAQRMAIIQTIAKSIAQQANSARGNSGGVLHSGAAQQIDSHMAQYMQQQKLAQNMMNAAMQYRQQGMMNQSWVNGSGGYSGQTYTSPQHLTSAGQSLLNSGFMMPQYSWGQPPHPSPAGISGKCLKDKQPSEIASSVKIHLHNQVAVARENRRQVAEAREIIQKLAPELREWRKMKGEILP